MNVNPNAEFEEFSAERMLLQNNPEFRSDIRITTAEIEMAMIKGYDSVRIYPAELFPWFQDAVVEVSSVRWPRLVRYLEARGFVVSDSRLEAKYSAVITW